MLTRFFEVQFLLYCIYHCKRKNYTFSRKNHALIGLTKTSMTKNQGVGYFISINWGVSILAVPFTSARQTWGRSWFVSKHGDGVRQPQDGAKGCLVCWESIIRLKFPKYFSNLSKINPQNKKKSLLLFSFFKSYNKHNINKRRSAMRG